MINKALSTAFTNLSAQFPANTFATTTAPFLDMDFDTYKFVLHAEINFYKQDQLQPILIFFNSRLHELFVGLRNTFMTYEGNKNYKMTVLDPRGTSMRLVKLANGTTYTFIQSQQEMCSISLWNPVASIMFCSSLLPVVPTQTSKPNVISNQTNNFR
jgi:hypothetical protein